ncbi:non-ribosomal peptide synthetase [Goodfellowiella coeruleoviolacea]|uniref:Amino acid adenylation domain-containing protein n=1 Tax=Goodfellowiella coeruleoviolacea TaxID=334858 RepID=A0AAE3GEZ2_9PSEU|nr:amino acid adenylation domain-containing protein [Goodfellowiella coeruleoviolacea]MCP2166900.1 amino acid adenylation domain-containing protein [Goodfellowiella coeruleoviolacea]
MSSPVRPAGRSLADTRKALLALREKQQKSLRATSDTVTPVPRDRALPLSFAQQRLWFLDQWAPGQAVYNSPVALLLRTELDHTAFQGALTDLVARHEVLRTRYPVENGVPYQEIEPAPESVPLPVTDLTGASRTEVEDWVSAFAQQPFDLERGPVLRAALGKLSDREHVLVLNTHHIATDGASTGIVTTELVELYQARRQHRPALLPALPVQYADYAVWQRGHLTGEVLDKQLAYWRQRLADLPTLDLPTDRPRPVTPSQAGATLQTLLPPALRDRLNAVAREERVTLLTVVLAAFTALMARYTGQEDIVLGSVFAGRTRPEVEGLVGFFANTLVLRTSVHGDPSFRELLARVNETVLGAHFHQDLPFGRLVEELRPDRDPSRNPLFQTCFTLQHATVESATVGDIEAETFDMELGTARFDLAVQLTEIPEGLRLWAEYSTDLFDTDRIQRLFDHYTEILTAVAASTAPRLSELPVLTEAEREALTGTWNDTARPVPDSTLHQLFESVVDRYPDAVATRFEGTRLTYAELDARANQLAWALRGNGVGPETVVGVLLERGPGLPTAFLGIHKAGGAYLPLDPDHPAARWELVLAEARSTLVVTTTDRAGALPDGVTAICLDALGEQSARRPPVTARPDNLAYLIFTSGSTGRPKGVQVEHRSIVNFTAGIIEEFRLGVGDRVLQFANPAFDVSLFDFFAALCSGATLVAAPRRTLLDPAGLTELMRAERVTVTDLPPAVLGLLDPTAFPDLRALFVGLEAFPGELVNRWNTPGREFHNGYGPTEATVACVDHRCPKVEHTAMPPIGAPLANYQAHVLDEHGNLVPVGVPGELHIGGVGVARGYANQPGRTAEKFVPDPFGPPGSRLYRTGDLVRRRANGDLEFVGRVDNQVKIRGLRVEPSEIEHVIKQHPAVDEVVVIGRHHGAEARLLAYLTTVDGQWLDTEQLRGHLTGELPAYLVPAVFTVLPELPRTASGKLDRTRLPEPGVRAAVRESVPPRNPTEETLAVIWRELLGLPEQAPVDVHDNFFAEGGTSLTITRLASRIRDAFGVSLQLQDLFTKASIAQLAELVEAEEIAGVDDEELLRLLREVDG